MALPEAVNGGADRGFELQNDLIGWLLRVYDMVPVPRESSTRLTKFSGSGSLLNGDKKCGFSYCCFYGQLFR